MTDCLTVSLSRKRRSGKVNVSAVVDKRETRIRTMFGHIAPRLAFRRDMESGAPWEAELGVWWVF